MMVLNHTARWWQDGLKFSGLHAASAYNAGKCSSVDGEAAAAALESRHW